MTKIHDAEPPRLLTRREAARFLSISERTLWGLTQRGQVPCVRIGRAVRYDRRDLLDFIERQKPLGDEPAGAPSGRIRPPMTEALPLRGNGEAGRP